VLIQSRAVLARTGDIQSTGGALIVSGNCSVRVTGSTLWGGTSGIVIHDQGHVIVENSTVGGGKSVTADGHGHGELRKLGRDQPGGHVASRDRERFRRQRRVLERVSSSRREGSAL
jgi:hypothetical protein